MKKLTPYLIPLSLLIIAISIFSLGYESKMGEQILGATTKIKLTDPNSVTPAATSTPTANMIPIASVSGTLNNWVEGFFGDGSDGDVTILASTTLTRDMYYNNLTINDGVVVDTGGYKIFVKNTLSGLGVSSTIKRSGNDASGITGGSALSFGSTGFSGAGGDGTASGYGVAGGGVVSSLGGQGGAGGGWGVQLGGAAGTITTTTPSKSAILMQTLIDFFSSTTARISGGSGGGGGGSGGNVPGAGGSGGGIVAIFAKNISGNLFLEAKGGNGSNATSGTQCGGGGGGGGGAIIIISYNNTAIITTDVSGGTAGSPLGGAAGVAGSDGQVILLSL